MASSSQNRESPLSSHSSARNFSNNSNIIRESGHGLVCGHGLPAKFCVSRSSGKRFYGCSLWPRSCGFIIMEEDILAGRFCTKCSELQAQLTEKEKRFGELENDLKFLVERNQKLKDKICNLQKKNLFLNSELGKAKKHTQLTVVVCLLSSLVGVIVVLGYKIMNM